MLTADVRSQTALGTLRSYLAIGETATNGNAAAGVQTYMPRAFIQLAGFTVGLTKSFYDYFSFASVSNQTNILGSDTSGNGQILFAYTAQFGNGLSASLSIEDPIAQRQTAIFTNNAGGFANTAAANAPSFYAASIGWPDIVGNINLEQAWGSAQIMGALHNVNASYYNGSPSAGAVTGNGHPSDAVGYAIGGGITFKLPMLGQGDSVSVQADFAKGATDYTSALGGGFLVYDGATAARGFTSDAVYNSITRGSLDLTEAWDIVGGYTHHWNPQWKTTLYGGYAEVNYSGAANALMLAALGAGFTGTADYSLWQIGSRTVWSPVKNLDLSVDVLYTQYNTGFAGNVAPTPTGGTPCAACYTYGDVDVFQVIGRWQRNFYP